MAMLHCDMDSKHIKVDKINGLKNGNNIIKKKKGKKKKQKTKTKTKKQTKKKRKERKWKGKGMKRRSK